MRIAIVGAGAWGTALAVVAALLLVAGGLQALQAASIVVGLPLAFVVAVLALAVDASSNLRHVKA